MKKRGSKISVLEFIQAKRHQTGDDWLDTMNEKQNKKWNALSVVVCDIYVDAVKYFLEYFWESNKKKEKEREKILLISLTACG